MWPIGLNDRNKLITAGGDNKYQKKKKAALNQLQSAESSQRDLLSGAGSHRPRVRRMDHAGAV